MIMPVTMVIMTLPRMSPTQNYRTILLGSVKNPKPHDGAKALAGDGVPSLGLVHGNSFVIDALTMVPSSHRLLSLSICEP